MVRELLLRKYPLIMHQNFSWRFAVVGFETVLRIETPSHSVPDMPRKTDRLDPFAESIDEIIG